jgi:hypothetical protein
MRAAGTFRGALRRSLSRSRPQPADPERISTLVSATRSTSALRSGSHSALLARRCVGRGRGLRERGFGRLRRKAIARGPYRASCARPSPECVGAPRSGRSRSRRTTAPRVQLSAKCADWRSDPLPLVSALPGKDASAFSGRRRRRRALAARERIFSAAECPGNTQIAKWTNEPESKGTRVGVRTARSRQLPIPAWTGPDPLALTTAMIETDAVTLARLPPGRPTPEVDRRRGSAAVDARGCRLLAAQEKLYEASADVLLSAQDLSGAVPGTPSTAFRRTRSARPRRRRRLRACQRSSKGARSSRRNGPDSRRVPRQFERLEFADLGHSHVRGHESRLDAREAARERLRAVVQRLSPDPLRELDRSAPSTMSISGSNGSTEQVPLSTGAVRTPRSARSPPTEPSIRASSTVRKRSSR